MKLKNNRLIADFGGTHARIAFVKSGECTNLKKIRYSEQDSVISMLSNYVNSIDTQLKDIRISGAGPIENNSITLTNSSLKISSKEVSSYFKINDVKLFNDAEASSYAIPFLDESFCIRLNKKKPIGNVFGLIVVGTGLGVSSIRNVNNLSTVTSSEGGYCHLPYPKKNTLSYEVINLISDKYPRISCERVISGSGLELLYSTLVQVNGKSENSLKCEEIVKAGLKDKKSLSFESCKIMLDLLGSYSASISLIYGSRGGVFLGGGLLQRLIPIVQDSDLLKNFYISGRMKDYVNAIPLSIINDDLLALRGCGSSL